MGLIREEMVTVLRRVSLIREEEHEAAVAAGEWRNAFEARLTNLVWRTIALSLELEIASPQFDPKTDPIQLARRLKVDCAKALTGLQPTEDKAAPFFKVQTLNEVLDASLDCVGVLQAWKGFDAREPLFLANRAVALGQAEAELALAENGHWDQVAEWRERKVGRPKGTRSAWREEAAPIITGWLAASPTMSRRELCDKLDEWLRENWHRFKRDGRPNAPDHGNLGNLLREMDADNLIKLNKVKTKSVKKRKT